MVVRAHFDGKVLVPDEPLDLPRNQSFVIHIEQDQVSRPQPACTARAVVSSGLIGLWRDRTDVGDSADFARSLRQQAQSRGIQ